MMPDLSCTFIWLQLIQLMTFESPVLLTFIDQTKNCGWHELKDIGIEHLKLFFSIFRFHKHAARVMKREGKQILGGKAINNPI